MEEEKIDQVDNDQRNADTDAQARRLVAGLMASIRGRKIGSGIIAVKTVVSQEKEVTK